MNCDLYLNHKIIKWGQVTLDEYLDEIPIEGWESVITKIRSHGDRDIIQDISDDLDYYASKFTIYPPLPLVFNAMDSLPPQDIRIVILGQDPYIREGQAIGWSFSVPDSVRVPPSLINIYKELNREGYTGYSGLRSGNLVSWVDRGVFLYNVCLTVNAGDSGSHGDLWNPFTNTVLSHINSQKRSVAWILLGKKAEKWKRVVTNPEQRVFVAGHPSPLNRTGNFIGSGVFKAAADFLGDFSWDLPVE